MENKTYFGLMALGLLLLALAYLGCTGCAPASPLAVEQPKTGDTYTCTTDAGNEVSTYYGGPSCPEAAAMLAAGEARWANLLPAFPCDTSGLKMTFIDGPIHKTEEGACDPYCYGTYQPTTQTMTVWNKTENSVRVDHILRHELGHHCLEQQTRFPKDEATDHCVMCASGYEPCECHKQADCLVMLFPDDEANIEAIRASSCPPR